MVSGDRVFLTAFAPDTAAGAAAGAGELLTLALDLESGRELWRRVAPRPRIEEIDRRNGPAAASPAVDAERVVVFFGDFGLIAYDHAGEELWRTALGPFSNLYGMGASPILHQGRVYIALDQHGGSHPLCVDAADGEGMWGSERPTATSGQSTPVLWRPEGGRLQLLVPGSFFLTSYDTGTGERLWWVRGLSFEMKSTPVLGEGLLYVNGYGSQFNEEGQTVRATSWSEALAGDSDGDRLLSADEMPDDFSRDWFPFNDLSRDGVLDEGEWTYFRNAMETRNNLMAIRLPAAGARGDLTRDHVAWQYFRSVPQLPSPVLAGGVLLMVNDRGLVTSFAAASGEVLQQGRIDDFVDSVYASPVASPAGIYLAGRAGEVVLLPRDGSLEPVARADFGETIVATPALHDGVLLVRTDAALYAFPGVTASR